jgi:hypothetical protein
LFCEFNCGLIRNTTEWERMWASARALFAGIGGANERRTN